MHAKYPSVKNVNYFEMCIFSIVIGEDCTTELSSAGLDFVMEMFYKYDQDEDDALSPEELKVCGCSVNVQFGFPFRA